MHQYDGRSQKRFSDHISSSRFVRIFLGLLIVIASCSIAQRIRSQPSNKVTVINRRRDDHKILPSISSIIPIDTPGKFSITAMSVEHSSAGRWYVPSFHSKNSAGWNRTVSSMQTLLFFAFLSNYNDFHLRIFFTLYFICSLI